MSVQEKQRQRAIICMELQKSQRQRSKQTQDQKVNAILHDFRGLKDIARIKNTSRNKYIPCIMDKAGQLQTDRACIVEVFAAFYDVCLLCSCATAAQ